MKQNREQPGRDHEQPELGCLAEIFRPMFLTRAMSASRQVDRQLDAGYSQIPQGWVTFRLSDRSRSNALDVQSHSIQIRCARRGRAFSHRHRPRQNCEGVSAE